MVLKQAQATPWVFWTVPVQTLTEAVATDIKMPFTKKIEEGFKPKNHEWRKRHNICADSTYTAEDKAEEDSNLPKWMSRMTKDEFNDVTRMSKDTKVFYGPTVDGKVGTAKYLRPKDPPAEQEKESVDYNVIASRDSIINMMNSAFEKHAKFEGHCSIPSFSIQKRIKKGVTERWSLSCSNCSYTSGEDYFKLYKEVPKAGRGAKKAEANLGVALGAQETGSQIKTRMVFACSNTSVMAKSALQNDVNVIGEKTIDLNQKDMIDKRANLKHKEPAK
jgi:hypothetical protein